MKLNHHYRISYKGYDAYIDYEVGTGWKLYYTLDNVEMKSAHSTISDCKKSFYDSVDLYLSYNNALTKNQHRDFTMYYKGHTAYCKSYSGRWCFYFKHRGINFQSIYDTVEDCEKYFRIKIDEILEEERFSKMDAVMTRQTLQDFLKDIDLDSKIKLKINYNGAVIQSSDHKTILYDKNMDILNMFVKSWKPIIGSNNEPMVLIEVE